MEKVAELTAIASGVKIEKPVIRKTLASATEEFLIDLKPLMRSGYGSAVGVCVLSLIGAKGGTRTPTVLPARS